MIQTTSMSPAILHRITFQSDGDTYRAMDEAIDDFGNVTEASSRIEAAQPEYAPEARFFYDWFADPLPPKKHADKIEIITEPKILPPIPATVRHTAPHAGGLVAGNADHVPQ